MTKFLLPLLLVGAAAPAFAQTSERPLSFERDGVRYTATVKTVGTTTLITGHEVDSGRSFDLRAKNGRVSGTYGTTTVNYTVGR